MLAAGRGEFRVDLGHFAERHDLARDLFTLGHLPIVAGTVVFAAAGEPLPAHP
jgi:low temperature requirement protein LtrA